MFSVIYIENEIFDHPRTQEILKRFPSIPMVNCDRYGEVFNRSAQDFRIQKQNPALILAKKHGNLVLPAPQGYGFEGGDGFYFSHMMNCLYDCRYCFLQGMYRSAHYVLFVNYEDFATAIEDQITSSDDHSIFYSGYDCDSLAMEPVSRFCEYFVPLFKDHPSATLEFRTKSTQIRSLLESEPVENCIVAMSFTSETAAKQWENKVPAVSKRIEALAKLQQAGWNIALRFEPVIYTETYIADFVDLFELIFSKIDSAGVHSVSIGEFRMPTTFHRTISKLYPDEALFAEPITVSNGLASLQQPPDFLSQLEERLFEHVSASKYYRCA